MSQVEAERESRGSLRRAYLKGYRFEQNVRKALENVGFTVFRCAGSKPCDLVAICRDDERIGVILIECKVSEKLNPSVVSQRLYEEYRLPALCVVDRGRTIWEWHATIGPPGLPYRWLSMMRDALGPRYDYKTL